MFKKSRRKIVLSIMLVLALLFLGILAVIYGSSYYEVSKSNYEMLQRYVDLYSLEKQPGDGLPDLETKPGDGLPDPETRPDMDKPHFEDTPAFRLSTFYSVALDDSGEILATDNDNSIYENTELAEIAAEIAADGKAQGVKKNLVFMVKDKGDYTLVAFMDNTILQESITTLFRYTLIFGSLAMLVFLFLAIYLARRIVKPLEESYRKQKQFISDAGHELKTPVSVVSANAELLVREIGENKWLSNIQYENERMGALVTQLLELVRTENVSVQMESIDFSRLVYGELLPFESIAFEKGIRLISQIEENICISGNSGQLKQLISILLDNALQHGTNGKEVALMLKCEKTSSVLSVINDGNEIQKEQQAYIFERFYRMDTARNGEDGHYGLGLAIAKAIVTAHKGRIGVECQEGKVKFIVHIPMKK